MQDVLLNFVFALSAQNQYFLFGNPQNLVLVHL
jgi:hypothetical protein